MFSKLKQLSKLQFHNFYSLFIQAQTTPNPNFLKFVPGGMEVMRTGTYDFARPRDAKISPLASQLFQIDGIVRVFYAKDYISVSKAEEYRWEELKPHIFSALNDHFAPDQEGNEKPLFIANFEEAPDTVINKNDSEAVQLIKEIIDTRIRPNVQEDGGDIVYRSFDEETGIVYIYMKGSCAGCPSSSVTLKSGIERMLVHYIAEVNEVIAEDYPGDQ